MNYHKSLSVYTLLNSAPIMAYIAEKTQLDKVKNKIIVDVGGGNSQTYCTFFTYPETIEYYLIDPNLILLHDQYIRLYPTLLRYKINHILAYAENLPFIDGFADMVICISTIDHLKDYVRFIKEAYRILKQGGILFITSHLDIHYQGERTKIQDKIFSFSFWERLARYLYYRRYNVKSDDHTYHFKDTFQIEKTISESGFRLSQKEIFKRYFYLVAEKP